MFRRLMVSEQQRKRMLNVANVSCCLCGMDVEKTARVIHHCHLSGTIFGVARSKCNLRARTTNFLPVFSHNLSRYDAHHVLKHRKLKVGEELSAIAKTDETYIPFSINIPVGTYKKQSGGGGNWLNCINLFASSTAINLFLKVYKILQRH